MKVENILNDAVYARQSLFKEDSISIETQMDMASRACKNPIRYYRDSGFSGGNTKRPEYIRLMADIKKGIIKRVVVYKLDRFSRSLLDFVNAWEYMAKYHVEFVSVTENFDTSTPMGEAMLLMAVVFAQLERKQISARVKDNYYARAPQGNWIGGPAPYGFTLKPYEGNGDYKNTLISNEKIENVKTIFETYKEPRVSLADISDFLRREEILSPSGDPTWPTVALARMLRNPVYAKLDAQLYNYYKSCGVTVLSDISKFDAERGGMLVGKNKKELKIYNVKAEMSVFVGNWCGVIDSRTFLQCQYKLDENRQLKRDGAGTHTWLSGLIKCEKCHFALVIALYKTVGGEERRYFRCSGRQRRGCNRNSFPSVKEVEVEVANQIKKRLKEGENTDGQIQPLDNNIQIELTKIDEKIQNLMGVLSNSIATDATIKFVNLELEQLSKKQLELNKKQEAQFKAAPIHLDIVDFDALEFEEKKKVAYKYISKIFIDAHTKSVRIIWKI